MVSSKLLENEVDVIELESDDDYLELIVDPTHFHSAREVLDVVLGEDANYLVNEVRWVAQSEVTLQSEEDQELFNRLLSLLDEVDDVQHVYHNVSLNN